MKANESGGHPELHINLERLQERYEGLQGRKNYDSTDRFYIKSHYGGRKISVGRSFPFIIPQ